MALIHIARNHKPFGTVTEEELREGISSGKLISGDLVWREGMAEWKTLGEMAQQWGMDTPLGSLKPEIAPPTLIPAGGTGPAWEDRDRIGFFPAITRTVTDVLMRPGETFASMKHSGGLVNPLLYFVLVNTAAFAIHALYNLFVLRYDPMVGKFLSHILPSYSATSFSFVILGQVLLSPAYNVLAAFILAGITHVSLLLVKGTNHPFETTFRFTCYSYASISVLMLVPVIGILLWLIWGSYISVVGLRAAQNISTWKTVWGLSLPVIVCCGIPLLFGIAGILAIAAKAGGLLTH